MRGPATTTQWASGRSRWIRGQAASSFRPAVVLEGGFVNELSDEALARHIEFGSKLPTLLSTMQLSPINGAGSRVGRNDTAWSYRDVTWGSVIAGIDPDPANAGKVADWAVAYWEALHPYRTTLIGRRHLHHRQVRVWLMRVGMPAAV